MKNEEGTYLQLLQRYEVWDYNEDNTRSLSTLLGKKICFVKLGYVPQLSRIVPHPSQDIDVLFYGSMNARRKVILDELCAAGLVVRYAFGAYGRDRDELIIGRRLF